MITFRHCVKAVITRSLLTFHVIPLWTNTNQTPIDLIKIKLQTQVFGLRQDPPARRKYVDVRTALRYLLRTHGPLSLWQGWSATGKKASIQVVQTYILWIIFLMPTVRRPSDRILFYAGMRHESAAAYHYNRRCQTMSNVSFRCRCRCRCPCIIHAAMRKVPANSLFFPGAYLHT